MPKQGRTAPFVLRPRTAGTTLHSWLYQEIRAAILDSRLEPGLKLPARKVLARQCHVSIGTVTEVYDRLVKLGYLDARAGSGTYVGATLPEATPESTGPRTPGPAGGPRRILSARGRLLAAQRLPRLSSNRAVETFRLDRAALEHFPIETWNQLAAQHLRRRPSLELLAHGDPLGFRPLRAALAAHVGRTRGVRCDADQVVITSGTQHSLDLVARLLLDPGDQVWMEDPGYAPVTSLLRSHGAEVIGIPVDTQGLDCVAGRLRCPLARLAYVTPGCQFPLGVPMSHRRRLQLLDWANEAAAWIFEDDYDGLLRCDCRQPQALRSLDGTGGVIYSNSLNRMLFSSLRLGFLILPPAFIEPAAAALSITQRYQPTLDQATLADFITLGHFDRHLRRLCELYTERREALIAAGKAELGGLVQFSDSQFGSQVLGWLAADMSEAETWRRSVARNIAMVPLASLTIGQPMPPGLVFGLGAADARAIRTAIKRLGRVLRVLAWQTRGASSIQNKVPVRSRSEISQQTQPPIERRRRPEPQSSSTAPARSPRLAPMLSPRFR
ncbi:MAG: PLP-dependent aminotransferase family protein [Steroidobacteraceae bacterium]